MLQVIICPNQFGSGMTNPLFFDAVSCCIYLQYFKEKILEIDKRLRLMRFNKNPFCENWLRAPSIFSTDDTYPSRFEDKKLILCAPDNDEKILLLVKSSLYLLDEMWVQDGVICSRSVCWVGGFAIETTVAKFNSFDGCLICKDINCDLQIFSIGMDGYNRIVYEDFVDFIAN